MDITVATQLIGSLGFPIACSVALFISLEKERERHKEEIDKITDVVAQNTAALNALKERLV